MKAKRTNTSRNEEEQVKIQAQDTTQGRRMSRETKTQPEEINPTRHST